MGDDAAFVLLNLSAKVAELERKLEAAQSHAAERVAEQRAHAAAAHAEAAELRAKLASLALMTPLDGDARKHLVDKLDEQRWQMERELAEALGEDYRGLQQGDDPWREMLRMVRAQVGRVKDLEWCVLKLDEALAGEYAEDPQGDVDEVLRTMREHEKDRERVGF